VARKMDERYIISNINLILKLLRLFNKATREVYSNHLFLQTKKFVWYDKIRDFDFLKNSTSGILFRKEILILHTNFLIFHYNHIISDRLHHTQMTSIRDHELPEIYYKGLPVDMIIGELELIDDVK
jgi:hypothetical protein